MPTPHAGGGGGGGGGEGVRRDNDSLFPKPFIPETYNFAGYWKASEQVTTFTHFCLKTTSF